MIGLVFVALCLFAGVQAIDDDDNTGCHTYFNQSISGWAPVSWWKSTYQQCCEKCESTATCAGWDFNDPWCSLKEKVGTLSFRSGGVAGIKKSTGCTPGSCGDGGSCKFDGSCQCNHLGLSGAMCEEYTCESYDGYTIDGYSPGGWGYNTWQECCGKCQSRSDCVGFNFDKQGKTCWLKNNVVGSLKANSRYVAGIKKSSPCTVNNYCGSAAGKCVVDGSCECFVGFSGTSCEHNDCNFSNKRYSSHIPYGYYKSNKESCCSQCAKMSNCVGFEFNNGICWIMTGVRYERTGEGSAVTGLIEGFCASTPCRNGGICRRDGDSHYCECTSSWSGTTCEDVPTTTTPPTTPPPTSCVTETDSALTGDEEAGVSKESEDECCAYCDSESDCAGWTFNTEAKLCFKKLGIQGAPFYMANFSSGVRSECVVNPCGESNNGECQRDGTCKCYEGWAGDDCEDEACGEMPDTNVVGGTNSYYGYSTSNECCKQCKSRDSCVAWTWKPGPQCYLHNSFIETSYSSGIFSGIKDDACVVNPCSNRGKCAKGGTCQCLSGFSGDTCETDSCNMMESSSLPGSGGYYWTKYSWQECCSFCETQADCAGWVYEDHNNRCWKKTSVGEQKFVEGGAFSGVRDECKDKGGCGDHGKCVRGGTCECDSPWEGEKCDYNPCDPDPCGVGGTCKSGAVCDCVSPVFSGDYCETNTCNFIYNQTYHGSGGVGYGASNEAQCCKTCYNHATCVAFNFDPSRNLCWIQTTVRATTRDSVGRVGGISEAACAPNPCVNGVCKAGGVCDCDDTWLGDKCDYSPCDPNPCNNGRCSLTQDNGTICTCNHGWEGEVCDTERTEETDREGRIHTALAERIVANHNKCRNRDGVGNVTWDDDLSDFATWYSQVLANKCGGLTHSTGSQRKNITNWVGKYAGENLAMGSWSEWDLDKLLGFMDSSVNMWCDGERPWYNYDTNTCDPGKVCGHYTQVVWEESNIIGCGVVNCAPSVGAGWYVTCVYMPGGNWGRRPFNKFCQQEGICKNGGRCGYGSDGLGACECDYPWTGRTCEDYSPTTPPPIGTPAPGSTIDGECNARANVTISGEPHWWWTGVTRWEHCCDRCKNSGSCVAWWFNPEKNTCGIKEKFTGMTEIATSNYAGIKIAACDPNPCKNGGKCKSDGSCECVNEYTGLTCEDGGPTTDPPTTEPTTPAATTADGEDATTVDGGDAATTAGSGDSGTTQSAQTGCDSMQENTGINGGSNSYFTSIHSKEACCSKCESSDSCVAMTFDASGPKCWIHSSFIETKEQAGRFSAIKDAACANNPCQNRGKCSKGGACNCITGFSGSVCQASTCNDQTDTTFSGSGGSYWSKNSWQECCSLCAGDNSCVGYVYETINKRCFKKYTAGKRVTGQTGKHSGVKDACANEPCGEHGKCKPDGSCVCDGTWEPPTCSTSKCHPNPCKNGGTCSLTGGTEAWEGDVTCKCKIGWTGDTCEEESQMETDRPNRVHSQFRDAIVARHNECRAADGLGPVTWDNDLEDFMMYWNKHLADQCTGMEHSPGSERKNITNHVGSYVGENLAAGSWSRFDLESLLGFANSSVRMWCNEKADYTYATHSCKAGKACGHYTQVVWETSTVIGCGMAMCPPTVGAGWYVGCVYLPGGNYAGVRPFNLFCQSSPCQNGGECVTGSGGLGKCDCEKAYPFGGEFCDVESPTTPMIEGTPAPNSIVDGECNARANAAIDGPGGYYAHLADWEDCCNFCQNKADCVGWSFREGPKCWIKTESSGLYAKDGSIAGLKAAVCFPNPCNNKGRCKADGTCSCLAAFSGLKCDDNTCDNTPDTTIQGAGGSYWGKNSWQECCAFCESQTDCAGYVFDPERNRCFKKTGVKVNGHVAETGTFSGVRKECQPNPCGASGNGECQRDGTCKCYSGFTGADCETAA